MSLIIPYSNPFIDDATVQSILERTSALCPELDDPPKIVRNATGLRPTRIGGPRFENEIRSKDTQ